MRLKNQSVSLWDVANYFATLRESSWARRPMIFFFVNQANNNECTDSKLCESAYSFKSTVHVQILFCILNGKDAVHQLEKLLSLPALRDGSSNLEELLLGLLRQEGEQTGRISSKVLGTLPFLLDFPIWPSAFIPPTFNVTLIARLTKDKLNLQADGNRKFISAASADLTFFQLRDEFEEQFLRQKASRPYCVWIISSPPGSGKTLTLKKLESYAAFKQKKVFVVNLVHHYQYIKSATAETVKIESILTGSIENLLPDEKPTIFLDGFDDICPELREKGLMLIKSMADMQVPLVVATRPHELLTILSAISANPSFQVKILPFDSEKQLRLLMQISSKGERKCRLLIEKFHKSGFSDVLQNPLHLILISNFVECADDIDFFEVYKVIVDEKLHDAVKNKDKGNSKCLSSIKIGMALSHKLARQLLLQEPTFSFTEEKIAVINSTGIASISGPENVECFHKSVAEFLVADSYLYDLKIKQASIIPMFESELLKQCRVFINSLFSQKSSKDHDEDSDSFVFYLKSNKEIVKTILETAAKEGLVHIFKIALSVIVPFRNCPPPKEFESDIYLLLETACESSEEIAIRILKTGVLKHLDRTLRPEKICRLTEKIASNNLTNAYRELKQQCDELEVILKRSKTIQALIQSVKNDHVEVMLQLLESGIDTEIMDENGLTALLVAARGCKSDITQHLLNNYAELNARDAQGRSCLFYAAYAGRLETVEILVRENQELLWDVLQDGSTVLHYAVHNEDVAVFRFLVEKTEKKGSEWFYAVDQNGWNVFHRACAFGNLQHLQYVLEKLISNSDFDLFQGTVKEFLMKFVNLKTEEGQTPLMLAAYSSGAEFCSFLVGKGAEINAVDSIGNNAAHYAVAGGKLDVLQSLLEADPKIRDSTGHEGRTLLHQAVAHEKLEIVKFLIDKGAHVNACDANSATPLHYSCQKIENLKLKMCSFYNEGSANTLTAPEKSSFKNFKLLRDKGSGLHSKNAEENTALHYAAHFGLLNNTKSILKKDKSRVNEKNLAGRTPLHMACAKGHLETARALLRHGANLNARDIYRSTPLTLTAQHSTPEVLAFLIKRGADVRAKDRDGENGLHCACRGGKLENVKLLISTKKFSMRKKNSRKMTALEIAVERGHQDIVDYFKSIPKPEQFPFLMQVLTHLA
ncbi:Hypothetical predicted protein [Cloeon dipterum]|uniref:NACHT domain-containing protein n=1 Tax=Cloeon dipterum TaxID=197152 RepID=A0A8S1CKW7_9INSE|nr:Hypothetical predicted protein [Cloeon dipterum]